MTTPTPSKTDTSPATITRRVFGASKTEAVEVPAYLQQTASPRLLAQAVHTQLKRVRVRRAHTKERAEVRGGGRKPWAQKGTGRSRHGSSRSPLWVGGGTTFGPRSRHERVLPLPLAMKRRALAGALQQHVAAGSLSFVAFGDEVPSRTQEFVKQLPANRRGLLLIIDATRATLVKAGRNVPGVRIIPIHLVTTEDVLRAQQVWVDELVLGTLERRCVS